MSTFDTNFAAAVPNLFTFFGTAATYTPPTGDDTDCTVVINETVSDFTVEGMSEYDTMHATIEVQASQLTPVRRGAFTIGSTLWHITNNPKLDAGVYQCDCESMSKAAMSSRRQS